MMLCITLPSSRRHLSYDSCLEGKRENYQNCFCAVLCTTVVRNDAHTHVQFLKMSVGFGLSLVFVSLFRFSIFVCFSGLA